MDLLSQYWRPDVLRNIGLFDHHDSSSRASTKWLYRSKAVLCSERVSNFPRGFYVYVSDDRFFLASASLVSNHPGDSICDELHPCEPALGVWASVVSKR